MNSRFHHIAQILARLCSARFAREAAVDLAVVLYLTVRRLVLFLVLLMASLYKRKGRSACSGPNHCCLFSTDYLLIL